MKTKRTLRSLISSLCCLAMLLAWLPVLPAAAAETATSSQEPISEGKNKWVIFQDDFDSYAVGEDSFYGANSSNYTYVSSYHGTKSNAPDASYSLYSIVNKDGGKVLDLTSVNTMRNWFVTKVGVTGAYSVQMDIQFVDNGGSTVPGFILNPFQGYTFPGGKTMLTYFYPSYIQLIDNATTGSNVGFRLKDDSGSDLKIGYDQWYTIKISVDKGAYCIKAWPAGTQEPVSGGGVLTVETSAISDAVMAYSNNVRIYNMARSKPGEPYTTLVDNLQMYKTYDQMTIPSTVFGVPGETLSLTPEFTGTTLTSEQPDVTFSYQLDNPALGSVNKKNELVLGPGEGTTTLKLTLADVNGKPTGAGASTTLVVGSSNGLTAAPAELKVAESAIGTTKKVDVTFDKAVTDKYPNPTLKWTSSNESVAKVAADGTVTLVGFGKATITAMVTANGKDTAFFASIPVQVGEQPLRILSIGNSHSRDSFYYLSHLAAAAGKRVEAAYLHKDSGMLRHHAHNLVTETADYSYYKADPMTGVPTSYGKNTIQTALADGEWDYIMLHQGTTYAGAPGTFDSDLEYIIDYVKAEQPNAKVYWMLGWVYEDDFDETRPGYTHAENFKTYYNGSQAVMYNAYIDCFEQFIWGENAKYGDKVDGWFPTGLAIQNLRATYGDTLTRDGFHLALTNGRLTAAMAILKTLYPDLDLKEITLDEVSKFLVTDHMEAGKLVETDPDYANTEANLQLIRDAVNAATADLTKAPKKLPVPKVTKVEEKGTANDLTIGQATAPLKYFFPDVKTMSDGTIFVSAYKNIYHKPAGEAGADTNNMNEGYGTMVGWYSKDNGKTWSEEFDLVTEDMILDWAAKAKANGDTTSWAGVETLRGRYALLENNPNADYFVMADPRDPNFAVVNVDGKELLVMTVWISYYREDISKVNKLYMMWSEYDAKSGKLGDWSQPMLITRANGGTAIKRGDIAVFPNGRILIPYYSGSQHGGIPMVWDANKDTFVYLTDANGNRIDQSMAGQFATDESATINEISFVAPPNSTGMVYAFARESGEVLKSMDYGMTWEHFGNADRIIHQPGFQVVDEDRVYVTWARAWASPRFVYGKMMYVNGAWDDTDYELVYASPNTVKHDMGDPSSTLMANGKLLVVCYDTEFRSIVGTVVDPDSPVNTPVELNSKIPQGVIFEKDYAGQKLDSKGVTADATVSGSYSVDASFKLGASGKLTIGDVSVTTSKLTCGSKSADVSLAADTLTYIRMSFVGNTCYVKVWQGDKEPGWTLSGTNNMGSKVTVTGSDAALNTLKVSRRVLIEMPKTKSVTTSNAPFALDCAIMPVPDSVTWTSSNPKVATVKDGVITVLSEGQTDITVNAGGVKATCTLIVSGPPAQMSGKGEKVTIFSDDFQNYGSGNLWEQMKANGYNTSTTGEAGNSSTLVLESNGSEQYLKLNGKSSWIRVNEAITGDYTAQFDFKFGGDGTLYATLNQGKDDSYATRAFIHLVEGKTAGTRIQYDESGTATNYPENPAMHGGVSGLSKFGTSQWYTIKITRADQGLYVKLWKQGEPEPEQWSQFFSTEAFDTELAANQGTYFRLQWASSTAMYIDNLTITQQQGKGADFMLDVPSGAWYYDAVDYAIKNGIMSGYNSISFGPNDTLTRAQVVQVLYNKEGQPAITGKHNFPDVPADQWFNNAITWGSQKGVVGGFGDGKFRPNDAVTIEQVAVILWNYSGNPKFTGTPDGVGKYDDWAKNGLSWAVENGIMKGVPIENATDNATRAQTAQMLMNFLKK